MKLQREHLDKQGFDYGVPMMLVPMVGGSGPNYLFINILNVPIVTAGVSCPGSQNHAPNENIRINDFIYGTKHMVRIIKNFGNL